MKFCCSSIARTSVPHRYTKSTRNIHRGLEIYVDTQAAPVIPISAMARDAYASLRLPADLKAEVQAIATSQQRSLSHTIQLLLWRGVQGFKRDGLLLNSREAITTPNDPVFDDEREQLSEELARVIAAFIMRRSQERKEKPPRRSRDGPKRRQSSR